MAYCKHSKFEFWFLITVFYMVAVENSTQTVNDQQAALLAFRAGIVADPKHALETWNASSFHVCNWSGVLCNERRDIVELDLKDHSLHGTISPALFNLSFLEILDLSGNFFEGYIPSEIGSLSRLKELSLSSNILEGNIPREFGVLHELVYLDLSSNHLTGEIPVPLLCNGSSVLQYIDLSNNSLGGKIPPKNECGLRELRFLLLWSNQLLGEIPPAQSNSSKLQWLDLESNFLGGKLPSEIVNKMTRLQVLYLSYNNFRSHSGNTDLKPFFASLSNSSHLRKLGLTGNQLGGQLPSIIGNLSTTVTEILL